MELPLASHPELSLLEPFVKDAVLFPLVYVSSFFFLIKNQVSMGVCIFNSVPLIDVSISCQYGAVFIAIVL